jgi:alpha-amylase
VQNNTTVTVNSSGQFTAALGSNTALALHTGKPSC